MYKSFEDALSIMEKGGHVESLESHTEYSMNLEENQLYSEGLPVARDSITPKEMLGEWREVYIIETKEQWDKLLMKQREELIQKCLDGFAKKREFDEQYRTKSNT